MWITIRNIVLIQYRNNNKKKKKIVFGAILNLESLVEAVENLTVCWSWSRCGYVHWRWSCELILQSVVTHVLSINKERQELSHDNGGVCFDFFFFFPSGNLLFTLCIVLKYASAQSNVNVRWRQHGNDLFPTVGMLEKKFMDGVWKECVGVSCPRVAQQANAYFQCSCWSCY